MSNYFYDSDGEPHKKKKRANNNSVKELTVPIGFTFASDARIRNKPNHSNSSSSIPLAELIKKIENQTPETWKRVARAPSPARRLDLTVPIPFTFHSTNRHSTINADDKLSKSKTTKMFRARPLNRKIFESTGDLGVPRIPKRPLTEPISPRFTKTKRRIRDDKSKELMIKNASKEQNSQHKERTELKNTIPEPFKLVSVEKHIFEQQKMMERIKEEKKKQEKRRKFKANPLPIVTPFRPVLDLKFTEPKPFDLISLEKHEIEQEKMKEMIQAEKEAMIKRTLFKSRPFINKKPFQVKSSNRLLTEIDSNFVLKTDLRAKQRESFNNHLMEIEVQKQKEDFENRIHEEERKRKEIKKLRMSMIHKPLPVPSTLYEPEPHLQKSNAPLTEPKTPNFSYKRKKIIK